MRLLVGVISGIFSVLAYKARKPWHAAAFRAMVGHCGYIGRRLKQEKQAKH